jgi:hypothetical protein
LIAIKDSLKEVGNVLIILQVRWSFFSSTYFEIASSELACWN